MVVSIAWPYGFEFVIVASNVTSSGGLESHALVPALKYSFQPDIQLLSSHPNPITKKI